MPTDREVMRQVMQALETGHFEKGEMRMYAEMLRIQIDKPDEPDGWKLVPVEPTDQMIAAGLDHGDYYLVYQAMINAAPQVETPTDILKVMNENESGLILRDAPQPESSDG